MRRIFILSMSVQGVRAGCGHEAKLSVVSHCHQCHMNARRAADFQYMNELANFPLQPMINVLPGFSPVSLLADYSVI